MRLRHLILILSIAHSALMHGQTEGIDAILGQVEANNPQLQAIAHRASAQKASDRAEGNLPDPTISYSHVWDSDDSHITEGELIVSQTFDFPTLYASRARATRARADAIDAEAIALRRDILHQARLTCLELIGLQRMAQLLNLRMAEAEQLQEAYNQLYEAGEATQMEVNRLRIELLNLRTQVRQNQTAMLGAIDRLNAVGAEIEPLAPSRGLPDADNPAVLIPSLVDYPADLLPADFTADCARLLKADPYLQGREATAEAARREVGTARQGYLPQIEVGYRRNTESRHPLNGMVVGLSVPLFSNHGRTRAARLKAQAADMELRDARLQAQSRLWQLYDQAVALRQTIGEHQEALADPHHLGLLRQAVEGGQISLTDYFAEASAIYDCQARLIETECQYHMTVAELYKNEN